MEPIEHALQKVEQEVSPVIQEAGAIAAAVIDERGHDAAKAYLQRNAAAIKIVETLLEPFVKAARQVWIDAVAQRDGWLNPLKEKRAIVEPAIVQYRAEEERKRLAEQRRLEDEARKRAEEEQIAAAEAAAKAGDTSTADAILEQPIVPPAIILPRFESKGAPTVVTWSAEVTDLWSLVQAVAKDRRLLNCLSANTAALNQTARAQKAEMDIPGVKVIRRESLRVGTSRAA